MHLIKDSSIIVTKTTHTAEEFIRKKIELLVNRKIEGYINAFFLSLSVQQKDEVEPFYAVDLEDICNKHIRWLTSMPRVTPHYGTLD